MNFINAILIMVIILLIYLALIKIYMTLFIMTGLSRQKARFQVVSLITGVGFTTSESEIITFDKRRRNIALAAMVTGMIFNVVIIGLLINIFVSLNTQQAEESLVVVILIISIAVALLLISKIPPVNRGINALIEWLAKKIFKLDSRYNVLTLLDNYGKEAIVEVLFNKIPDFMEDKSLAEIALKAKYNINVMMVKRKNRVLEINKDTIIQKGDLVLVFGSRQVIHNLFSPANGTAYATALKIGSQNTIHYIDNYGQDAMAEIECHTVPDILRNKPLCETVIRSKYFITVLKIKRFNTSITVNKDTIIRDGDVIIAIGPHANIHTLFTTPKQSDAEETNTDEPSLKEEAASENKEVK
jgi:Trk K+ transport system NAD-binding subunit